MFVRVNLMILRMNADYLDYLVVVIDKVSNLEHDI